MLIIAGILSLALSINLNKQMVSKLEDFVSIIQAIMIILLILLFLSQFDLKIFGLIIGNTLILTSNQLPRIKKYIKGGNNDRMG